MIKQVPVLIDNKSLNGYDLFYFLVFIHHFQVERIVTYIKLYGLYGQIYII